MIIRGKDFVENTPVHFSKEKTLLGKCGFRKRNLNRVVIYKNNGFPILSISLIILILLIAFVAVKPVLSRPPDQSNASDESVKELEKKRLETEKKLREKELLEKEMEVYSEEEIKAENADVKFLIKEIELKNDDLLGKQEKKALLEPYINKEISYNDINLLVMKMTNTLIAKGYITARVKVPLGQNLKGGKLTLLIIKGYIEDIVPSSEGFGKKAEIFVTYPFFPGRLLDINELDYGIEQMNKIGSNNAKMKVLPGKELGYSKIEIENDPSLRLSLGAGIDNLGSKATGEYRKKFNAGYDELLHINDSLYMDYTSGLNRDKDKKYNRSYTLSYSFSLGYWFFSSVYSRSAYMQLIHGLNTEFESSGTDTNKILGVERVLWKGKLGRIKGKGGLTLKNKKNYIEDALIETSSRKLSVAKIGIEYSDFIFGGFFMTGVDYHMGLKQFGAHEDESGLPEDSPRAQFRKYTFTMLWNRQFMLGLQSFGYLVSFNGQYANKTLYSSEKMSIGDQSTIRGFKEGSAAGDRGYYIRNEISVNDFSRVNEYLGRIKIFIAYDFGYVVEKSGKDANYGQGKARMSGCAAGISYANSVCDFNISYGRKIKSPDFVKEKDHNIYFSFNASFTGLYTTVRNSGNSGN